MRAATEVNRYQLLRRIGAGGMAELLLARQVGLAGFEKLVAIKRILPHRAMDPKFERLFLNEARTAADLRHANIVQVLDVGKIDNALFMALEFVHGFDLATVIQQARLAGGDMPLEVIGAIILDAARGLHYAHTKKDLQGRPLDIVHRDISPDNIMVGFDGVTRVADFGVALARSRPRETRPGIIRGKVAYMSPEQARALRVDARSDQYSLAVVLWELVAGRRLIEGDGASALLAAAAAEVPPPETVAAGDVPEELSAIILKALAARPDSRFSDCGALVSALEDHFASANVTASASRVASYLEELFPPETRVDVLDPATWDLAPTFDYVDRNAESSEVTFEYTDASDEVGSRPQSVPVQRILTEGTAAVPLVGRQEELEALRIRFERGGRIVTLVGPPGVGKTRLAREYGKLQELTVWSVDLTHVDDEESFLLEVASTLGLALGADRDGAIGQIAQALNHRGPSLVVMDNYDTAVDFAADFPVQVARRAVQTRFLITSRRRLGLSGEQLVELGPLGPAASRQLFLLRCERTGVRVDDKEAASRVKRLDGLPLAIELAAARADSETQVARTDHTADAVLRDALQASWERLSDPEQQLFAQCSIFHRGFDLAAIREVASAEPGDVAERLDGLVAASLLQRREDDGQVRFRMLEPLREFASDRLKSADRVDGTTQAHAKYFVRAGLQWRENILTGLTGPRWRPLHRELPNLTAAFKRDVARGDRESLERAVQILMSTSLILELTGQYRVMERMGRALISQRGYAALPPALGGEARCVVAQALYLRNEFAAGLRESELAVQMGEEAAEASGPGMLLAGALVCQGSILIPMGRPEDARAALTRALVEAERATDTVNVGLALLGLARCDLLDVPGETAGRVDHAVAALDAAGFEIPRAIAHNTLGTLYLAQRDLDAAAAELEKALRVYEATGVPVRRLIGSLYANLGLVERDRGNFDRARIYLRRAISNCVYTASHVSVAIFKAYLGTVYHEAGHGGEAAALYARSVAAIERGGATKWYMLVRGCQAALEAARGDAEIAERYFDEARNAVASLDVPAVKAVLLALESLLRVEQARHEEPGSPIQRSLIQRARDRLAEANESGVLNDDGRFAARLAERGLAELTH